jgi:hypothetical protein
LLPTIILCGIASLAAYLALAFTQASLGSPLFFGIMAVPCVAYALITRVVFTRRIPSTSSTYIVALLFAIAFRLPLVVPPVSRMSDMVRYIYDGRVQRLGYNPYLIVPSDPKLAATQDDLTRGMPSRNARTPYGATAQLFFRLLVTVRESPRLMKAALTAFDLLTIAILAAWLRRLGRDPLLVLAYAWHPLVILEIADGGHIDALGAVLIALTAWLLASGRRMQAMAAFALAVATKPLPIVLLPLFWRRVRSIDAAVGLAVLIAIYLPFASAGTLPLGALPNVVTAIRFNGPVFQALRLLLSPQGAAGLAVVLGLVTAAWVRLRTPQDDPAGWAWPMGVALLAAPVIYPWYLITLTPFFISQRALPLIVWAMSIIQTYIVWELAYNHGHRWVVPVPVMIIEYAAFGIAACWLISSLRKQSPERSL